MPSSRKQVELGHQLGVASKTGNMSAVQALLAAGAEKEVPTFVSGMMMTPLNAAAYTNNVRSLHICVLPDGFERYGVRPSAFDLFRAGVPARLRQVDNFQVGDLPAV